MDGLGSRPATVAIEWPRADRPNGVQEIEVAMWGFQSKRNALREQLVLAAPEANPHEFVRRVLLQKSRAANAERLPESSSTKFLLARFATKPR